MTKIKIEGGHKLTGEIQVSGAKNSAVALIPAAILCDEEVKITNVPNISDVNSETTTSYSPSPRNNFTTSSFSIALLINSLYSILILL
mgnify:CR=1 FL=1